MCELDVMILNSGRELLEAANCAICWLARGSSSTGTPPDGDLSTGERLTSFRHLIWGLQSNRSVWRSVLEQLREGQHQLTWVGRRLDS